MSLVAAAFLLLLPGSQTAVAAAFDEHRGCPRTPGSAYLIDLATGKVLETLKGAGRTTVELPRTDKRRRGRAPPRQEVVRQGRAIVMFTETDQLCLLLPDSAVYDESSLDPLLRYPFDSQLAYWRYYLGSRTPRFESQTLPKCLRSDSDDEYRACLDLAFEWSVNIGQSDIARQERIAKSIIEACHGRDRFCARTFHETGFTYVMGFLLGESGDARKIKGLYGEPWWTEAVKLMLMTLNDGSGRPAVNAHILSWFGYPVVAERGKDQNFPAVDWPKAEALLAFEQEAEAAVGVLAANQKEPVDLAQVTKVSSYVTRSTEMTTRHAPDPFWWLQATRVFARGLESDQPDVVRASCDGLLRVGIRVDCASIENGHQQVKTATAEIHRFIDQVSIESPDMRSVDELKKFICGIRTWDERCRRKSQ